MALCLSHFANGLLNLIILQYSCMALFYDLLTLMGIPSICTRLNLVDTLLMNVFQALAPVKHYLLQNVHGCSWIKLYKI